MPAPSPLSRREVLVAGALWALLSAWLFRDALTLEGAFFYRDVFRQYWPVQEAVTRAFAAGRLPLWNDATQGGVPLLANLHAGVFYPPHLLFRALEFHRAYALLVWAHHAGLGLGVYVALRARSGPVAAATGALAVGWSAFAVGLSTYLPLLSGLSFTGWQLVVLSRVERAERRVALTAGLLALQILAGDPFPAMVGTLVMIAWLLGAGAPRRALLEVVTAGLLALGLAAVQLWPAWALLHESVRAAMSQKTALAWSFHPARLMEWIQETPFGSYGQAPGFQRFDLARGPDARPFLQSHFLGVGALGFAALGLLLRRGREALAWAGLAALGLTLSLGEHVPLVADLLRLPPFSFFRYPEKYQWLCVVGVGALAALGVEAAGERLARAPRAMLLAPLLLLVELVPPGQRLVWLVPHAALHAVPTTASLVSPGWPRVWRANSDITAREPTALTLAEAPAEKAYELQTWASSLPTLVGVHELGGYSPVSLERWQRVVQAFYGRPDVLYRMFGVRWFVTRAEVRLPTRFGVRAAASLPEGLSLFEYRTPAPRAFSPARQLIVPSREAALEAMNADDFDPLETAVLEEGAAGALEVAEVAVVSDAPGRVELAVGAHAQNALVVLSETWATGWRAHLDDRDLPALAVDGTLLGALVPPGPHRLTFLYGQPGLAPGAVLTALALLLAGWLARPSLTSGSAPPRSRPPTS